MDESFSSVGSLDAAYQPTTPAAILEGKLELLKLAFPHARFDAALATRLDSHEFPQQPVEFHEAVPACARQTPLFSKVIA
jgi:hypothetical protein